MATKRLIRFCLGNPLIVYLLAVFAAAWGVYHAPFDWTLGGLPRDPVAVDAIPNLGENQQIVFTSWPGRSPRDVEDQLTYPLSVALQGVPAVRTIRSASMTGFSSIYVIFEETADFYESRARLLEKLSSLPEGAVPDGVKPTLGPDATPLGQVFWYTLEGRDPSTGAAVGGWDLAELRTIQDWYVRRQLAAAEGVAEVAGVGGFVREYHIEPDPDALRVAGLTLHDLVAAAQGANAEVGAKTIEHNRMEYLVRGAGFARTAADFAGAVVSARDGAALRVRDVARVVEGPAPRDGALDKDGVEAVGGVVVARHGANPMRVVAAVKARIDALAAGLPRKTLDDGAESVVTVVPFYDRSLLIDETLDTLNHAIRQQVLVTVIVILVMLANLRTGLLVSSLMPLAVLLGFGMMRWGGVDANIVSLSGIAIAVGTISDMGIVLCENILNRLREAPAGASRRAVVYRATAEVGGAVATAVATTIVGFLPILAMVGAEGRLFKPLAYTKTFVLFASIVLTLTLLPSLALMVLRVRRRGGGGAGDPAAPTCRGAHSPPRSGPWARAWGHAQRHGPVCAAVAAALALAWPLAADWTPLGADRSAWGNYAFVVVSVFGLIGLFFLFLRVYPRVLGWCLRWKAAFLALPLALCVAGATMWLGWDRLWGWFPRAASAAGLDGDALARSRPWTRLAAAMPGFGKEFMPSLDEGSFLSMPTTMPHAAFSTVVEWMGMQDRQFAAVPEVAMAVGKAGRAESPLDPAPTTMFETIITYVPEYLAGPDGRRPTFRFDPGREDVFRAVDGTPLPDGEGRPIPVRGAFVRGDDGALIPDPGGRAFRLWRPHLRTTGDLWRVIERAGRIPGVTGASRLYPIEARNVMLQTGLSAPMGVKVFGPTLEAIGEAALGIERLLREVPAVDAASVAADRPVAKPYLEVVPDRDALHRHGATVAAVLETFETAVGGRVATHTVEGRERYAVRVRYPRELRDSPEAVGRVLAPTGAGVVPLAQLAEIRSTAGPEMIRAEDTFLIGYVTFGGRPGLGEVEVVEAAARRLAEARASGEWRPPEGVTWAFSGAYENQVRSEKRLAVVLPASLFLIFLLIYLQFRNVEVTFAAFSAMPLTFAGGMILLWCYGRPAFLDIDAFGVNLRDLFQIREVHLSVAVWVGFLALFGIATDDGVVMTTYLEQSFARRRPGTVAEVRAAVLEAGLRRVRPCLMTTATTLLALLPILTSRGRGAEVMAPMSIPAVGGMTLELLAMFIVPTLYCWRRERLLRRRPPKEARP